LWAVQESKLGEERAALVSLFSKHQIAVKGGRAQAEALMDDLVAWRSGTVDSQEAALPELIAKHEVLVKGGQEQAEKLMDDLTAWKSG
jgi:hypothetical protein